MFMLSTLFVTTLLLLGCVHSAPASVEKRQQAQVIYSCTVPNTAALTFDDGPYNYIYDISRTLVAANATGTFFFNGNNYGCIYSQENRNRVKYVYDNGHQVASHTWGHRDLSTLTWDQIHDEMWRVELALRRITGAVPAFMRPPYGSFNNMVRDASYIRGQKIVIWDFDSGDSTGSSAGASKASYDQLVSRRPSNVLTLNHETYSSTAYDVIPHAISRLRGAGYRLVSVAECLGLQPYQSVGSPETPSSSWTC